MASDNGEQGQGGQDEQSWPPPPPPPQQPPSQWAPPPSDSDADQPASDAGHEDATIAGQVRPPSAFDDGGDAPTTRYGQFTPPPPAEGPPAPEAPAAQDSSATPEAPAEPAQPSPDDDRTQAFSRSDLSFESPGGPPAPTQQMSAVPPSAWNQPHFPPPPPAQQPQAFPPPPQQPYGAPQQPPPQGYPPQPPYQQPPQQGYPPAGPGYGQGGYPGEPGYPGDQGYPPQPQQPYGAPPGYGPYGQQPPPYQPYQAAPPRGKGRLALWIGIGVVVVIGALVAAAFIAKPGFLFKKVLDHSAVEQTIEKKGYTNVKCNDGKNPKVKKGATFTCTADGGTKLTVTIVRSNGDYTWAPSS